MAFASLILTVIDSGDQTRPEASLFGEAFEHPQIAFEVARAVGEALAVRSHGESDGGAEIAGRVELFAEVAYDFLDARSNVDRKQ
jgi:hypothetical protein